MGDKRFGGVPNDSRAGRPGVCAWFVRAPCNIDTQRPSLFQGLGLPSLCLALIKKFFLDPSRRFDRLINENQEIYGSCRHRTTFHTLIATAGNTSADDPD